MNNRRLYLWFFVAALFLASAHVYFSFRGRPTHALIARAVLLSDSPNDISAINIEKDSSATASFVKGRCWELVKPYAASVEPRQIMRLLDAFATAYIQSSFDTRELARLGRTQSDFGLESPRAQVLLESASGAKNVYAIGNPTPTGDGVYVAVGGEDMIYVVDRRLLDCVNSPIQDYRKKSLFVEDRLDPVMSFDIRRGPRAFSRFAYSKGAWRRLQEGETPDAPVSTSRVNQFLQALAEARADSFVWPVGASNEPPVAPASLLAGYGLDAESAITVTLRNAAGTANQLSFGASASSNQVYALIQNTTAIARVPAKLVELIADSDFNDSRLYPYERQEVQRLCLEADDVVYSLVKSAKGTWEMESPVLAPANGTYVNGLLANILALKAPLETAGEPVIAVSVGIGKEMEPARQIPSRLVLGDSSLQELRSQEMLDIAPSEISRLTFISNGGTTTRTFVYDKPRKTWLVGNPAGAETGEVDVAAFAAVLAELHPLKAERIVKLKVQPSDLRLYGLEKPRLVVAIDFSTPGAVRRNLQIGEATQGGAYATVGAADAVFVLSDRAVTAFSASLLKTNKR
ncbi:MAG TPA: hypothetical protein DDY72_02565 [Verrucomicrobia bacterium]|nr:hypothetical protein [Verrucomicrobiota bacterium]